MTSHQRPGAPPPGPGPTQQQRLRGLLRDRVAPALRGHGFRRSGHTWRRDGEGGSWIVLQVQGSRHSTAAQVEMTVNTDVWPPGTWAEECRISGAREECRISGAPPDGAPVASASSPFSARPQDVDPDLPRSDTWWDLTGQVDADAFGDQLADYLVARALPWALERLDPSRAADLLLARGRTWDCVYAAATLRWAGASPARLAAAVEQLTAHWVTDPRPITLRPHLARWRRELELPDVELPEVWSPSMLPDTVARFGSAEAARAAGFGVWMHHWDGRSWIDRPGS